MEEMKKEYTKRIEKYEKKIRELKRRHGEEQ